MDQDLLQSFKEIFRSYKDPEKITQIIQMYKTINGKNANLHDFIIGSFYGESTFLFETFNSNDTTPEEFTNILKDQVEELNSFIIII